MMEKMSTGKTEDAITWALLCNYLAERRFSCPSPARSGSAAARMMSTWPQNPELEFCYLLQVALGGKGPEGVDQGSASRTLLGPCTRRVWGGGGADAPQSGPPKGPHRRREYQCSQSCHRSFWCC